jgi:hypothetical protein
VERPSLEVVGRGVILPRYNRTHRVGWNGINSRPRCSGVGGDSGLNPTGVGLTERSLKGTRDPRDFPAKLVYLALFMGTSNTHSDACSWMLEWLSMVQDSEMMSH